MVADDNATTGNERKNPNVLLDNREEPRFSGDLRKGGGHDIAILDGPPRREKLLRDFLLAMRAESARVVLDAATAPTPTR